MQYRRYSGIWKPRQKKVGAAGDLLKCTNGEAAKKAFEHAKLPVDYSFVPKEGRGYREDANVFMFYNKFDALMKRHLPTK